MWITVASGQTGFGAAEIVGTVHKHTCCSVLFYKLSVGQAPENISSTYCTALPEAKKDMLAVKKKKILKKLKSVCAKMNFYFPCKIVQETFGFVYKIQHEFFCTTWNMSFTEMLLLG